MQTGQADKESSLYGTLTLQTVGSSNGTYSTLAAPAKSPTQREHLVKPETLKVNQLPCAH